MDWWVWLLIAIVVLVVLGALAWYGMRARRTSTLRETFGPEYERTVTEAPTKREAESELLERQERREELELRPLPPTSRERYLRSWEDVQARFVDDPLGAVRDADDLIQQVMRDRGYPVEDFDQRAADLSVDHPEVVENYRAGHSIARRAARDEADTEELRQAFVHYRALFEDLLEKDTSATT